VSIGCTAATGESVLSTGESKAGGGGGVRIGPAGVWTPGRAPGLKAGLKDCHSRNTPPPLNGRGDISSDAELDAASPWPATTELEGIEGDGYCGWDVLTPMNAISATVVRAIPPARNSTTENGSRSDFVLMTP